jgi:yecA family protein
MQNFLEQLSQADVAELSNFLIDPKRPEGTFCFQELQGFLFAIASSPEMVPPSDWLPVVSNDEDISFKDQTEAEQVLSLIMTLFNQINITVLERSDGMPSGCEFQAVVEANFDEEVAISQWSRGFMAGHDWLADLWDEYVPESLDGECGSSAMVLSFFASRKLAEMYYLESTTTPRHRKPGISFNEFAARVRDLFPDALSSYAHLGRTISEALAAVDERNH